jgi:hypothetical protein
VLCRTPTNAADRGVVPRLLNTPRYCGYLRCYRSMPFLWHIRPTAAAGGVRHSTVEPSRAKARAFLATVNRPPGGHPGEAKDMGHARPNGDTSGKTSQCFEISADLQLQFSVSSASADVILSVMSHMQAIVLEMATAKLQYLVERRYSPAC